MNRAADLIGVTAMGLVIAAIGFGARQFVDDSGLDKVGMVVGIVGAILAGLGALSLVVYAGVRAARD